MGNEAGGSSARTTDRGRLRCIIDTDVGTDVDDLWTLAMVPGRGDLDLEAVTVVYGDTAVRARLAAVACGAMGLSVPIHRGRERPRSGKDVVWAGHEGLDVPGIAEAKFADEDAVDVLVAAAAREPGTLHVVAIGPLTNIAAAIEADATFAANLAGLTIMGGEFAHGWPEHNFAADAVATREVLSSGAPITIMPLDQTLRIRFDATDVAAIEDAHPIGPLLTDQTHRFWAWLSSIAPGAFDAESPAHDPAALLALLEPSLFTLQAVRIDPAADGVDDGRFRATPDAASRTRIVTDVDVEGVHEALLAALGVHSIGA